MKIIVRITESDYSTLTMHPLYECIKAKNLCDNIIKGDYSQDVIIDTVSAEAVTVYEYYGKKKGINVELYLNGSRCDVESVFASFNKCYDIIDKYCKED